MKRLTNGLLGYRNDRNLEEESHDRSDDEDLLDLLVVQVLGSRQP